MPSLSWALVVLAGVGVSAGVVGGAFYCRRWRRDRRADLGQVLVERSDALRRIDELAGALARAQQTAKTLASSPIDRDPRFPAATAEARRLDAELRHEVRRFLELNHCAERKGAAPETLRPPEAEALVCAHVA